MHRFITAGLNAGANSLWVKSIDFDLWMSGGYNGLTVGCWLELFLFANIGSMGLSDRAY